MTGHANRALKQGKEGREERRKEKESTSELDSGVAFEWTRLPRESRLDAPRTWASLTTAMQAGIWHLVVIHTHRTPLVNLSKSSSHIFITSE
jgi:hypothetical protein